MSYSFSARGPTKEAVLGKVSEQLDQIITAQPMHAKDRDAAKRAVEQFVDLVPLADDHDYVVSVNGSIGWKDGDIITAAGVGVSVHLSPAETAKNDPVSAA